MIYKNIKIYKPYLSFSCDRIMIPESGVTVFIGDNGSGKTTLMKSLVFDDHEVEFSSEKEKEAYRENRYRLFSYVPQELPSYNISVEDYLKKGALSIDIDRILQYFNEFSISYINLKDRFDKLSGGEKMKIAIIAAVIKDTPYIFMDEPTNHLDNDSVIELIRLIKDISMCKSIVLICHDPRLDISNFQVLKIHNNGLSEINTSHETEFVNDVELPVVSMRYSLLAKKSLYNVTSLVVLYLIVSLFSFLSVLNKTRFEEGYSYNNNRPKENVILAYPAEHYYSDTNGFYARSEKLVVDEEKYDRMINYSDIPQIAEMSNVEKVLVLDSSILLDELDMIVFDGSGPQEEHFYSIPCDFIDCFPSASESYLAYFGQLIDGRYPEDGKHEICVPYSSLEQLGKSIEQIGENVVINGEEYQLVGVLDNYFGLYLLSYSQDQNRGFYCFEQDSFLSFLNKQDESNTNTQELMIYTTNEKKTLNQLIESYPATNYDSLQFTLGFERQYNRDFIISEILPINIILSFVISLVVLLVRKKQVSIDNAMITDFSNYFISKHRIRIFYVAISIVSYVIFSMIVLLVNTFFSTLYYVINPILLLDMVISLAPCVAFSIMAGMK
ncbi:MAG: ABC transporter ATP-binding protein [Saccharofermentans sp.]|nr:ABC transporter ATP-binding protein [Saccharofermentans sp.]